MMQSENEPDHDGADCCTLQANDSTSSINVALTTNEKVRSCPQCGENGKPVDVQTVKALLSVSLEQVQSPLYHFCRREACPVVYFHSDGSQTFLETDIREKVYQKAPKDDSVFVCYCFRYTYGDIWAEGDDPQQSAVIEHITAGVQTGRCACEIRNPQGSCCLGNVRAILKQKRSLLESTLPE